MSRAINHQCLFFTAVLIAPALIVQAVAYITGLASGPSKAAAMPALPSVTVTPAPPAATPDMLSPQVEAARAFFEQAAANREPLLSPMEQTPLPPPAPTKPVVVHQAPRDTVPVSLPPSLQLSAIISGGKGSMAVINGNVYRLGDEVAKGWKLGGINAETLSVEITGPQGAKISVSQPRGSDGE